MKLQDLRENVDSGRSLFFVANHDTPPRMCDFFEFYDMYDRHGEEMVECSHRDPLSGKMFWFTHATSIPLRSVLQFGIVSLPYEGDFQIDSVRLWELHSGVDVALIRALFQATVLHLCTNGLVKASSNLFSRPIDQHWNLFAHDLTDVGMKRVRQGYRPWSEKVMDNGAIAVIDW